MSAFCVFGVSMEDCKEKARRKTPAYDKELKRKLSQEEFAEKVSAAAQLLFDSWTGSKQISPAFDAPQFCHDWISVAGKHASIRSPKIMCKGAKIDAKGNEVMRKGNLVIGWTPYKAV